MAKIVYSILKECRKAPQLIAQEGGMFIPSDIMQLEFVASIDCIDYDKKVWESMGHIGDKPKNFNILFNGRINYDPVMTETEIKTAIKAACERCATLPLTPEDFKTKNGLDVEAKVDKPKRDSSHPTIHISDLVLLTTDDYFM